MSIPELVSRPHWDWLLMEQLWNGLGPWTQCLWRAGSPRVLGQGVACRPLCAMCKVVVCAGPKSHMHSKSQGMMCTAGRATHVTCSLVCTLHVVPCQLAPGLAGTAGSRCSMVAFHAMCSAHGQSSP